MSNSRLLSTGFVLSIFLMANGLNAILGGFQNLKHVWSKEVFYSVFCCGISLVLSLLLIVTVATIVTFEIFIQKLNANEVLNDKIPLMVLGDIFILMILITTILFKFGTKHDSSRSLYQLVPFSPQY
jgi:membrane protein